MSNRKYSAEEKYRAIEESRKNGITAAAQKNEVGWSTLQTWIANYESMGMEGLQPTGRWTQRTEAEKHAES